MPLPLSTAAARLGPSRRLPRLLLVLDARLTDPLATIAALPPGAGVLLRHRQASGLAALGRAIAPLCRRRGLTLLVSGDWRLADALHADGLHLPEALARSGRLAPLLGWRRRRNALLTVAAHGPAALARARALEADGALLSPLFATRSHPGARGLGPTRFRLWSTQAGLPALALGGVMPATALAAVTAGAYGFAAIDGLIPPAG